MTDSLKPEGVKQLELALRSKLAGRASEAPSDGAGAAGSRPVAIRAPRPAPSLRLIRGEGKKREETLDSRDAVARVLLETGADMLLRRISVDRAEEIEQSVDRVLALFDEVDRRPESFERLQTELEELEMLVRESRRVRQRPLP